MTTEKTRVRFAPSPTGLLHVGNARTALYNWLFARHTGGDFLLRLEDTDRERCETRFEAQLIEDLRWLGLDWDEGPGKPDEPSPPDKGAFGPYRQSERLEIYAEHTERLLEQDKAYRCFCTEEELEAERSIAQDWHLPPIYSGRCRNLTASTIEHNIASGKPFAVRLRTGKEALRFRDLIRGPVEFAAEAIPDLLLVRGASNASAGIPADNYLAAIDDALMQITHVIREDDQLPDTPKQVAIYKAFDWPVPEFIHLPTIVGPDHQSLSERHAVPSISGFRQMGLMPEALVNDLALLGWCAEDPKTETFTLDELTRAFSLDRVSHTPATFDYDKLNWLNRHHLKQAPPDRLAALSWRYFVDDPPSLTAAPKPVQAWFVRLLAHFAPVVDDLAELPVKCSFVFGFRPEAARANPENAAILAADSTRTVLGELANRVRAHAGAVTPKVFKTWISEIRAATGIKGKKLFHPMSIALTGSDADPDFDKLIPLIEDGAALNRFWDLEVLGVRERIERFVGV